MKDLTQEEIDELTERTRVWAASEEGQRQLRESCEQAEKTINELLKARRIDPARLREPMTI